MTKTTDKHAAAALNATFNLFVQWSAGDCARMLGDIHKGGKDCEGFAEWLIAYEREGLDKPLWRGLTPARLAVEFAGWVAGQSFDELEAEIKARKAAWLANAKYHKRAA